MRFAKALFISMFLTLAALTAQAAPTISIDSNNHVWLEDGRKQDLGTIETLKKGTFLYHWAKATPEQAKAWHEAGRISPTVLDRLKQGSGFAGGGFYASLDPLDSHGYGGTLVVIELQKDIKLLRTNNYARWNDLWPEFARNQISGLSVMHTRSWLNIVDAEALTKEFVADAGFFKAHPPKSLPQVDEIITLTRSIFPELENDPEYKRIFEKVRTLMEDLQAKNAKSPVALQEILTKGSVSLKRAAMSYLTNDIKNHPALTKENILMMIKHTEAENKFVSTTFLTQAIAYTLSNIANLKNESADFVLEHGTRSKFVFNSLISAVLKLPPERASQLLQEAYYNLQDNPPADLINVIEQLKSEGKWHPPLVCRGVFR
jgi:hypothetical protein